MNAEQEKPVQAAGAKKAVKKTVAKKAAVKKAPAKKVAPAKKAAPAKPAARRAPAKKATVTKAPAKKAASTAPAAAGDGSARVVARINEVGGWRGETLARMRKLILEAEPQASEEVKWGNVPLWSRDGMLCTGESYKQVVKLTFAYGASLADPAKLFNSSLEGATRRAIDIREGEVIDAAAFKALVRAAAARNAANKKK